MSLLASLESPSDLRALNQAQLPVLAQDCRTELLRCVSQTGGHLASNLGIVELTIALHYVLETPHTPLIWDVGHQAYVHKMLTGRLQQMNTLRQLNGLAPFTKRSESKYDAFGAGHAGVAPSAALGMALANHTLAVAVIGDGSLTSGMVFEAMNHAGDVDAPLMIVLNDNGMSISKNVGHLHASNQSVTSLCDAFGFDYIGKIDGHDIQACIAAIEHAKARSHNRPVLVHVLTQKGKGYMQAENFPVAYHGVSSFNVDQGLKKAASGMSFSGVLGHWLIESAPHRPNIRVITPAMIEGSGLSEFAKNYPKQLVDVGIAEQHAVTLGAGMAAAGLKPIVAIYSTFLQRGLDQVIHDVALQNLPVIFAIDRAGLVGGDGATHHGAFDVGLLSAIPNMTVMIPSNEQECLDMFETAYQMNTPVAIRYPKGGTGLCPHLQAAQPLPVGQSRVHFSPDHLKHPVAILAFGTLLNECVELAQQLNVTLVDMRFAKPLDTHQLDELAEKHTHFICVEEHAEQVGSGILVAKYMASQPHIKVHCIGLPDVFIEHGSRDQLLQKVGLDAARLQTTIEQLISA